MKRNVLVTGATRGIGQAIATKFRQEGWYVIGTGVQDREKPDYLDRYLVCDLADRLHIEMLLVNLKEEDISTVVNNAGINIVNNFLDIKPEDFEKIV
jgi:NAD(P)-dependent dehydrogenase (short-subunit alcohol dehydrogenase family)